MCGGFETFSSDAGASKWAKKKRKSVRADKSV